MIVLKYLFESLSSLKENLISENFNLENTCIVEIYTAEFNHEEAVLNSKGIKEILPNSQIFGTSTCGVIFNGEQYDNGTLIIIKKYDTSNSFVKTYEWTNKLPEELRDEILLSLGDSNPKMINIVLTPGYTEVHNFVCCFDNAKKDIKLMGGFAGDGFLKDVSSYVFTDEGVVPNGVIINAVYGNQIKIYCEVNTISEPISPVYTLTKTTDVYWDEIDDIPATTWINEHVGICNMKEYEDYESAVVNDPLVRLHMLLDGHNGALRFLKYNEKVNKVSEYGSALPAGTKFQIGYTSPAKCVQRSFDICTEIEKYPIEDLFCYSCLFRKMYSENIAKWELSPFASYNVCGAFMLGEIANINGSNEYLNGSCVLWGTAENEKYILPNLVVFDDLHNIEDDNQVLLSFALKKQNDAISLQNKELINNLINQQEIIKKYLNVDPHFIGSSLTKYNEDCKEFNFDKICVVNIQNMNDLVNLLGYEGYYSHVKQNILAARQYLDSNDQEAYSYTISNNTFIAAANSEMGETSFLNMVSDLYAMFRFNKSPEAGIPIVSKFITVFHNEDLLKAALNALYESENSQEQYILVDKGFKRKETKQNEIEILAVLSHALENDGIIPYYQGIYDNKKKCISKYEALMRIVDKDGKVYRPYSFMAIAKKYHVYSLISERMIDCVFRDFGNKKTSVSINLSAFDINSKAFRKSLYSKLESLEYSGNLIFEIVEEEGFRDMAVLKKFITRVREYDVKIAIDDFGSGYSNLLEIAKIAPEYIKVDGKIIKDVLTDDHHKSILDTVIYLSEKIKTSIIAEYVENEEIYKYIANTSIDYSQGYYFSMPAPLSQII